MQIILEGILQGLFEWLYQLFLQLVSYAGSALLNVMSTDISYFFQSVPVAEKLLDVFPGIGWGLLLGNFAFQAAKSMLTGIGFEGEDPVELAARTFIFSFFLIFSRHICLLGLNITKGAVDLLGIPDDVTFTPPEASFFPDAGGISWILAIILGLILGIQLIKLFFEIAERYVVLVVLTLLAPLGFSMGGSKATKEICTGFIRLFASMCVMMVMNVTFMKLLLSALSTIPDGLMVFPWCLLIVGIARVARKIDSIITRVGLNPAITGDGLGRGGPAMITMMAAKSLINTASHSHAKPSSPNGGGGQRPSVNPFRSGPAPAGGTAFGGSQNSSVSGVSGGNRANPSSAQAGASTTQSGPSASQTAQSGQRGSNTGRHAAQGGRTTQTAAQSTRTQQSAQAGGNTVSGNSAASFHAPAKSGGNAARQQNAKSGSQVPPGVPPDGSGSNISFSGNHTVNSSRFGASARSQGVSPPQKTVSGGNHPPVVKPDMPKAAHSAASQFRAAPGTPPAGKQSSPPVIKPNEKASESSGNVRFGAMSGAKPAGGRQTAAASSRSDPSKTGVPPVQRTGTERINHSGTQTNPPVVSLEKGTGGSTRQAAGSKTAQTLHSNQAAGSAAGKASPASGQTTPPVVNLGKGAGDSTRQAAGSKTAQTLHSNQAAGSAAGKAPSASGQTTPPVVNLGKGAGDSTRQTAGSKTAQTLHSNQAAGSTAGKAPPASGQTTPPVVNPQHGNRKQTASRFGAGTGRELPSAEHSGSSSQTGRISPASPPGMGNASGAVSPQRRRQESPPASAVSSQQKPGRPSASSAVPQKQGTSHPSAAPVPSGTLKPAAEKKDIPAAPGLRGGKHGRKP